ncbi:MAG: DedA family protein [Streptosporangiaceae bacterium]
MSTIGHLIHSLGYWAVFLLVAAESLGVPLPGETALILAAVYAGNSHQLNPWAIFGVAAAAAIIGDNIGYWIGAKAGYPLVLRYGPKVGVDEHKLKIARYVFDRQGSKVVFFGRFVSILRTYAAFLAGVDKMRWPRFLVANAAGGIAWAAIYTFAAYFAGGAMEHLSGLVNLMIGGVAAAAVIAALLIVRHRLGRLSAQAEAAYPGSLH